MKISKLQDKSVNRKIMRNVFTILTALILVSNCISAQSSDIFPPKWVNNPPKAKRQKVYAIGYGQSLSQTIANEKARMNAFNELAQLIGPTEVQARQEPAGKDTTATAKLEKTKVEATLTDVVIVERASRQNEQGMYEVYLLVMYNKGKKGKKK